MAAGQAPPPLTSSSSFRAAKRKSVDHHHKHHTRATANVKHPYNWAELFQISGSVIPSIVVPVFVVTLWSSAVTAVYELTVFKSWIPTSTLLITILGVTLGLLIVFRTNTSYDRYWEGRRLWSTVIVNLRNLARLIWVGVHAKGSKRLTDSEASQKKAAMNLLLAFCSATKHFLRGEDEADYEDLGPYLQHLPEYAPGGNWEQDNNNHCIPIEIVQHLSAYVASCKEKDHIDANVQSLMNSSLNSLIDCFTNFERIRGSPIPLAYTLHLKQTLMLYLLALSFQLVPSIHWFTIPACFLGAFTMFGIEGIGAEIQNPFGYDANDLPIDQFCDSVHEELQTMMERPTKLDSNTWLSPFSLSVWPEHARGGAHDGKARNFEAAAATGAVIDIDSSNTHQHE